jgi:hypothetical protein
MLPNRFTALLLRLEEAGVDFILVGGLAAVLNGAPVSTFDVDIVHSRTEENIAKTIGVLESIDAVFRMQPERRLKPNATHLCGPGHLNLSTSLGPLDLLGEIGHDHLSYETLLTNSNLLTITAGKQVRVLSLPMLIELKEELAGQKDIAMLAVLKETLNEASKRRS